MNSFRLKSAWATRVQGSSRPLGGPRASRAARALREPVLCIEQLGLLGRRQGRDEVLSQDGRAALEGSQGVLRGERVPVDRRAEHRAPEEAARRGRAVAQAEQDVPVPRAVLGEGGRADRVAEQGAVAVGGDRPVVGVAEHQMDGVRAAALVLAVEVRGALEVVRAGDPAAGPALPEDQGVELAAVAVLDRDHAAAALPEVVELHPTRRGYAARAGGRSPRWRRGLPRRGSGLDPRAARCRAG